MNIKKIALGSVVAVAMPVLVAIPAHAHHSFAMFDMTKETVYSGVVLNFRWENPHSHLTVKVAPGAKDPSTVGTWDIECQAVNIMAPQGWNRNSFKPGDSVTLIAHPMKDGSKGASIFFAIKPDGSRLYGDIARPSPEQEELIQKELADLNK